LPEVALVLAELVCAIATGTHTQQAAKVVNNDGKVVNNDGKFFMVFGSETAENLNESG
jgi:hypothetical protein